MLLQGVIDALDASKQSTQRLAPWGRQRLVGHVQDSLWHGQTGQESGNLVGEVVAVVRERVVYDLETKTGQAQVLVEISLGLRGRAKVEDLARLHWHRFSDRLALDAASEEVLEPLAAPVDHHSRVRYDVQLLACAQKWCQLGVVRAESQWAQAPRATPTTCSETARARPTLRS